MPVSVDMDPELRLLIADRAAEKIAARVKVDAREIYDPLVDKKAAAQFLDCSTKYLDEFYMTQPGFPYHTKGRVLQYRISELSKWLDKHQQYA